MKFTVYNTTSLLHFAKTSPFFVGGDILDAPQKLHCEHNEQLHHKTKERISATSEILSFFNPYSKCALGKLQRYFLASKRTATTTAMAIKDGKSVPATAKRKR